MATNAHTLHSSDYCAPEIFDLERRRFFHGGWFLAARADTLARGNRRVIDVAGESIILARDLDDEIHAFANVCRHRGARLCDPGNESTQGSLMCPYHAWTYALDGRLIATPHLSDDDIDKGSLSLWSVAVELWEGFVFVCIAADPPPFSQWMLHHGRELLTLTRFRLGELQVAVTTTSHVAANWKIIVENYQECLHCTRVHPELVDIVPVYRTGWVYEHERRDGGVTIKNDGNSFSMTGTTELPLLPGVTGDDARSYFGCTMFPNAFVDVTGTCAVVTTLFPNGPSSTTVTMEYLFAPATIGAADFDPTPVVEFNELVGAQDNMVCERVQLGVASFAFNHGVLSPKDDLVIGFTKHYLESRGPVPQL